MIAFAAASAGYTGPIPVYRDSWLSPAIDFPISGINADSYTQVAVELTVDPHGGAFDCRAKVVAGNSGMAAYTCKLLKVRALFDPARDPSGRRMYGVDREMFNWVMIDKLKPPFSIPRSAHFELKVPHLPPGTKQPAFGRIQFAVDVGGNASACSPAKDEKERALAELACAALGENFHVEPARDRKGQPVASVQNADVKLEAGQR